MRAALVLFGAMVTAAGGAPEVLVSGIASIEAREKAMMRSLLEPTRGPRSVDISAEQSTVYTDDADQFETFVSEREEFYIVVHTYSDVNCEEYESTSVRTATCDDDAESLWCVPDKGAFDLDLYVGEYSSATCDGTPALVTRRPAADVYRGDGNEASAGDCFGETNGGVPSSWRYECVAKDGGHISGAPNSVVLSLSYVDSTCASFQQGTIYAEGSCLDIYDDDGSLSKLRCEDGQVELVECDTGAVVWSKTIDACLVGDDDDDDDDFQVQAGFQLFSCDPEGTLGVSTGDKDDDDDDFWTPGVAAGVAIGGFLGLLLLAGLASALVARGG